MKKLLSALLVLVSALCIVPFAGCNSEEVSIDSKDVEDIETENTTEEVNLSSSNYSKYLVFSADIVDIDITYVDDEWLMSDILGNYFVICIVSVSAAPKCDCIFDVSKVSLSIKASNWTTSTTTSIFYITPDCFGYGSASIYMYRQSSTPKISINSSDITISIIGVSGTVTV